LGNTDRDGSEGAGGPLESQAAVAVSEERPDPLDQVRADSLSSEEVEEKVGFHVIKSSLNIKEKAGDFVLEAVKGVKIVLEDAGSIGGGSPREGPTLEGVDEGAGCSLG